MHELQPFATTPSSETFQVLCDVELTADALELRYRIQGPIDSLVLPQEVGNPQFRDELWMSTCLEVFLQPQGQTTYEEWNFSPSGNWAYYHFREYRRPSDGGLKLQPLEPLQWIRNNHQLLLQVDIPLFQTFTHVDEILQYGVTAVLQLKNGEKQYWALQHAGDRPDFHLATSFVGQKAVSR